MNNEELLVLAARKKYRFTSIKGELIFEDLWRIPLKSKNNNSFDLDSIAKYINRSLKVEEEESFVTTNTNPVKTHLENKLTIIKLVIATKIKEAEDKLNNDKRLDERRRLLIALDKKQEESIDKMTEEEIDKRLKELS